ncbi:major facilitator superfamily domain-containing protein 6-B-like [Macrobrachium nipponense]|uniref:major facilitator superfamily domain-containing protein 6-B-like n=1 Tax=Macrobrachium nipponense TaxID=159736 RepID=UPI0030C7BFBD
MCLEDRLTFKATTKVSHFDKGGLCTFFPVNTINLYGEEIVYPTCPDIIRANSSVLCDDKGFMNYIGTSGVSYEEMISHYEFWLYLICIIIAWSGFAITVVMSDTVCFQLLGAASNKYGQQRLFGSLGWGTLVIITGGLIDYASEGDAEKDYTPAFVLCVAVLFIDLFVASRLHLMLVEDVAFEWNCHFQALKLLQGLIMGVQCFGGELPFFFLSGWFIKKLGHVHAMSLVIGVFGIRYILYYTVTNPWVFLPIELMNGFTFGIFYATMTSYASHIAPLGTEATMQGIVGAAFEGIGIAIGGFVGGAVFATVGGSKMFLFTGIFNLIFAAIHVTLQILLDRLWIGSVSSGSNLKQNTGSGDSARKILETQGWCVFVCATGFPSSQRHEHIDNHHAHGSIETISEKVTAVGHLARTLANTEGEPGRHL